MSISPKYAQRESQAYVAIRDQLPRDALGARVPHLLAGLHAWLASHGLAPSGTPFLRYLVVDYNTSSVEIDLGTPVHIAAAPDEPPVRRGILPGGQYVTVTHSGSYDGLVTTTAELLAWAKAHQVRWQVQEHGNVTVWASRVEHYLIGPPREPNPARWRTEIAILLAQ